MHSCITGQTIRLYGRVKSLAALVLFSSHLQLSDTPPPAAFHQAASQNRIKMTSKLEEARHNALWGLCIADALAMPVHWYYNPEDIKYGYGDWLTGYRAPNQKHPSSILSLSAVDGSGRSGWHAKSRPVVGNVILQGKDKYWMSSNRNTHYHQGMKAGDNTLNALCAVRVADILKKTDPDGKLTNRELQAAVLEDYVQFLTTPDSHNDTYAESFHRAFFKDWDNLDTPPRKGKEILEFAEERYAQRMKESPDSQLAVIGSFVMAIPWILHRANQSADDCAKAAVEFVRLTHPVPNLETYVDLYARLLHAVLHGKSLRKEAMTVLEHKEMGGRKKLEKVLKFMEKAEMLPRGSEERLNMYQEVSFTLGSACYIQGAMSTMLFTAMEFHEDFEGGVLANANIGGENCHRGAALGALLGAATTHHGVGIPAKFKAELGTSREKLRELTSMKNEGIPKPFQGV
ncbi:uncharacterized protein LOC106157197 [Lingula anatina]|uniref:Uncharacterized protein LOC106157197 n=1 Tax=Lingula anatina TaxID=7574 RepID=A0A1S3HQB2_LINAN|nr:uncharacterized protein LOC106157197 [Lingula anatina]XP_013388228.1 uncharacterized protein LOC106157197 [Lingula anatina]|eukprot:XP_013388227.1 uncharacterized protein LOC106157197 [Lingula anatina]